jgi:acetolactate synthase-1/2/3 large subunit
LGLRAEKPGELASILKQGLDYPGAVIIDVVVSKEENVFPIIPAGQDARNMILK